MTRRREPDPIAEQNREDAARRADEARSDAEYCCAMCKAAAEWADMPSISPEEYDEIAERDSQLDAQERLDNQEGL